EPLRAFLHGPGILRRPVGGRAFRSLLFRLSRAASVRARAGMGGRDLAVRLQGPIDQVVLRNLVIWHDRLLPPLLGRDDAGAVDLTIVLAGAAADEARLFDLVAIVLLLERIRGFALIWDGHTAEGVTAAGPRGVPGDRVAASDLAALPRDVVADIGRNGSG